MDDQTLDFLVPTPHSEEQEWKPLILRVGDSSECEQLRSLHDRGLIREVIDGMPEAVVDLFKISFPYIAPGSPEFAGTLEEYTKRYSKGESWDRVGAWVYFPWKHTLVHLPDADDYFKLRTARNKFLITEDEQEAFYNSHIGIAGMSVGSSVLNSIVLSGGGRYLRIADPDVLAITNLNRLPGSVCDLERSKCVIAARKVFEMSPYQEVEPFFDGYNEQNGPRFFGEGDSKLNLFIEEMDNIMYKISSRFRARELGIPVIMATDNGDNAFIDVERFDLEPDRPLFHGSIPEETLRNVPEHLSMSERVRMAGTIVGFDITPRTQNSLMMVGTKLPSWPQLGNAATLSGAATSYIARRILSKQEMPSGRYFISFDQNIDPDFDSAEARSAREANKLDFIQGFNLLYGQEKS
jgi:molybdopterin/thiamine biosynthesis adenylyltransferase